MALSGVLTTPMAQAQPDLCTWQVSTISPPGRDEARLTHVTGSNSAGDYSGYVGWGDSNQLVLWTDGHAEVQPSPEGVTSLRPVDENSSGTVLLNARSDATGDGVAFLYTRAGRTYLPLPLPAGFTSVSATAINERGDVVGRVQRKADERGEVAIWPVLGSGPIVLDLPQLVSPLGVDIDDDGTVLIGGGYDAHLWRDGVLTTLTDKNVLTRAIRNGKAVGAELSETRTRAVQWKSPTEIEYFHQGIIAERINRNGLVAGTLVAWTGPAAVWQGTNLLGGLPLPKGADSVVTTAIGDDNVVYGYAKPDIGPVRWDCAAD